MPVDRSTVAAIDRKAQEEEKGIGLCKWGPEAISFLEALVSALPWWNAWTRPIAMGAVGLLKRLLDTHCEEES